MSLRPQDDKHLVALHARARFHLTYIDQILFQFLEDARAQLSMRHLAPAKPDGCFNFVTVFEPLASVLHAVVVIVIVRAGTELHFLDGYRYLLLLGLVCLLLGLVLKFSEVNNSANWRIGCSSNFHEVETFLPRLANCISNVQDTERFTLLADNSYLRNTNSFVNAGDWQAPIIRTLAAASKACSYIPPPLLMSFEF